MTRIIAVGGRAALAVLLLGPIVFVAAVADAGEPEKLTFAKHIEPILARRCHQCHTASTKTKGGLDMTTYKTFMKGGQRGQPVEPGKSAHSVLYKFICRDEKPFMPPPTEEPVAIEELLLLKQWIDEGARGPGGDKPPR